MLFFQLPANPGPLQAGEIVDKKFAFEVVTLVLHANREQAIEFCVHGCPVGSQRLDPGPLVADHGFVKPRDRKAALFGFDFLPQQRQLV